MSTEGTGRLALELTTGDKIRLTNGEVISLIELQATKPGQAVFRLGRASVCLGVHEVTIQDVGGIEVEVEVKRVSRDRVRILVIAPLTVRVDRVPKKIAES